jgi:proline racemase
VLFMHNEGYSTMCGHGVIAVVTILLTDAGSRFLNFGEKTDGLTTHAHAAPPNGLSGKSRSDTVVLDSPAGQVHARATISDGRVAGVSFRNVPSFVLHGGVPVRLGNRELRADVAFGGAFYAIVDSEAAGIPIVAGRLSDLRRAGMEIKRSIEASIRVMHPCEPDLHGVYGTIFTGPPSLPNADLRNVTVFADAEVDRSPCGTGTCAVMAVLAAMGVLGPDQTFTHESIIGTTFRGRVLETTSVGDVPAIVPEISGEAHITGETTFVIDERDPLAYGFRL